MNEKIRTFLAIRVPKELSEPISELQKFLKCSNADAKWSNPQSLHYTLKFFGYITKEEIEKISSATKKISSKADSFQIEIEGLGGFPTIESPRVLWIGMSKGSSEMKEIQKTLEKEYSKIGIPKEEKKFRPHLTLCRIKSNDNRKDLIEKAKQKQPINIGSFKADELVLFSSKLTKKGPIYEVIEKFKLG